MPMLGTEDIHTTAISDLVILFLGVGSAVIDNVPLVAASILVCFQLLLTILFGILLPILLGQVEVC